MRENSKINFILNKLPLENILFETDNEATSIEGHYLKFSENTKISISELDDQVSKNFQKIFIDP